MSFGYNPYGGGRGRGTRSRRGVAVGAPFSGVLASGGTQVSLSPNQVNPQTNANTWREQHGDVYQQYNQPNASYSANQYSHNENIKQGEFPGRWPADEASWQSWQGDLAGNQQQNTAKDVATPLLRCSLCNIDFTDRKRYDLHCAGMLHKQKMREKEPQLMEENAPDRLAEAGGSPWPSRETGGGPWPSRDSGGSLWPPREPYTAPMSSGEDPNRWNKQSPLSRNPQAADRPKKMELEGRDSSQSEQSAGFLKPILKNLPVKATLAQSGATSQFPGGNRTGAPAYAVAGGRTPQGATQRGDAVEPFGYRPRDNWSSPFEDTKQHQDSPRDRYSTEQFQQRINEEFSPQLSERQGEDAAWTTSGGVYRDGNTHQRGESEEWRNQDRSSFGRHEYPGPMGQSGGSKGDSYGDRFSGDGMYAREEPIPGLDMLPDHQRDQNRQSEWSSQESQQTGFSSNLWEKEDSSKPRGGGPERAMPFHDWEHRERGQEQGRYEQRGVTSNRSDSQRDRQSSQKMSESADASQGGRMSSNYENIPEQSLQSGDYRHYGMAPEAAENQHGRRIPPGSYKPQYEQQGMMPKPGDRQHDRGRQSSLYDKLQTMSKPTDGQQVRRQPSDNFGQTGMEGRGMPPDNWQQQGLPPRHQEGQRGPGVPFGERQQQGLIPRSLEGQCGPGSMSGDKQQPVDRSWMTKSSGSSVNTWRQEHRSEPWLRPPDAGGMTGQRQDIMPLMQLGRDLSCPDGIRDFRQPEGGRDMIRPDRVFGQPDGIRDLRQSGGGRDLNRPDGSLHQQPSVQTSMGETPGIRQDQMWSKQAQKGNNPTTLGCVPSQAQAGILQRPAPGLNQTAKIVCPLCEIQLSESNKTAHEASIKHCAKYLYKQIVLGCKDFGSQFPTAVFGLTDAYSVAPPAQKPVKLLIYRCGLVMKYECAACSLKCFGQSQWYTHIRSTKHLKHCEKVISQTGLEGFLDIYGVLPLVQPEECDSPIKTPGTQDESLTQMQGQDARSSYSQDKVTTMRYEMAYPVSGASAPESRSKLTVYEYSLAGAPNTSTQGVVRRPTSRILDPSGIKRHMDAPCDPVGAPNPSAMRRPVSGALDSGVMGCPVGGALDSSVMRCPVGGALDSSVMGCPVGGTLDPKTVGYPVSLGVDMAKVPAPADSNPKLTVFEYGHTSRLVAPQPSGSMGVLDEQSIKKIADTISDIKNASKQQDNSPHPDRTVKGIFPIADYYSTKANRSSVPNHGSDASRHKYPQDRKDNGQRPESQDRDRSRDQRKNEERGLSERTRASADFGVAEQRSRYGRLPETGADSRRQPRDVDRHRQEHRGGARSQEQRSQEQRRPRGDEASRHRDVHRSTSRASGSSDGSRKAQSDSRTKSAPLQIQAAKSASSQGSRSNDTKPSGQTQIRTVATKKAEQPKQVPEKSAASKQSVTKQSQVDKDRGKMSLEKPVIKQERPQEVKRGEQTGSKPSVVKTEVKQEAKQPVNKPLIAKTEVKKDAKAQSLGNKVPPQPAAKKETNKKPDVKKPATDDVKKAGNGVKKEPTIHTKTDPKGAAVKDKTSKADGEDKKAPLKPGSKKPDQVVIELTSVEGRERSLSKRGDRSDVSSRSNKSDSERSFSQNRDRVSASRSRERQSGKERGRPYRANNGRGRPGYEQEPRSSSHDRGPQSERQRTDPHAERFRHDPHSENARYDPEHDRHDPHAEHGRHDPCNEHARHDPHGERPRYDHHTERDRHDPLDRHDRHDERPRHDPERDRHDWPMRDEDSDWERQRDYSERHNEEDHNEEGLQHWLDEEHWLDRFGEDEEDTYEEHRFGEDAQPVQEQRQQPSDFRGRGSGRGRSRGRGDTRNRGGHRQFNVASCEPAGTQRRFPGRSGEVEEHVRRDRRDIRPEPLMAQRVNAPDELMDMDTAVAVFTQTLQQFVNSLQGQTTSDRHMGGRVARLTPEEHLFVEQIEAMTGIHDAGTILSAIDILQNMDSKVIQTLGSLDPSVIQELFTGNLSLQGCGGMDMQQMVQSMLWSGAAGGAPGGLHAPVEDVRTVEIAQRGDVGWRGRGRWNGRGRFPSRGMGQKRFYEGRGRGGPQAKRGRPFV